MPIAVDAARTQARAHLGRCLRAARAFAGLSQTQAAVGVRVRRATVGAWEAGEREPMALELIRFADLCGVSLAALVGREQLPVPHDE